MRRYINFKILLFETSDSLHLKLKGDFDGSSALELINTLEEYGVGFRQILIDTNDLKTIYPFGRNMFQKKLGRNHKKLSRLIFFGANEHHITQ